jgi:hypothetical protein
MTAFVTSTTRTLTTEIFSQNCFLKNIEKKNYYRNFSNFFPKKNQQEKKNPRSDSEALTFSPLHLCYVKKNNLK